MAKQTINLGAAANDGTGDGLRVAGAKMNANFTEVYDVIAQFPNLDELTADAVAAIDAAGAAVVEEVGEAGAEQVALAADEADRAESAAASLSSIFAINDGIAEFGGIVPVLNPAPASTFEAGGVVSIPDEGFVWFDIEISPAMRAALIAGQCDVAVVKSSGTTLPGVTLELYNGATIIGSAVALVSDGAGGFVKTDAVVDAAMTKYRVKLSNTGGTGTAKVHYPEVRLVTASETAGPDTMNFKEMADAQVNLIDTLPVNLAAAGPLSYRKLAGAGATPTYNSATGTFTIASDVQGEIVYLNGPEIRTGDTVFVSVFVGKDETLAGPQIEAIPVRAIDHTTGAGAAVKLTRGKDGYWTAFFTANDADSNAPGSIVLRPDTRASGLRAAQAITISDIYIGRGTSRPASDGLAASLEALRDAVTVEDVVTDNSDMAAWQASRAKSSANAASANYWVRPIGSDVAAGTEEAPFATFAKAVTTATAGQRIAFEGGQSYVIDQYRTLTNIGLVGVGIEPAVLDARQHIAGSWTATVGRTGIYEKAVTFREATVNAGVLSDTWNYASWLGNTALDWKVGGASIAANLDALEASASGFVIHRTGSTVQDPRSDTNATGYTIYVKAPGGTDPTTQNVSTADMRIAVQLAGGTQENIEVLGAAGKDATKSSSSGIIPTLRDFVATGGKQHGWVGPARLSGHKVLAELKAAPGVEGIAKGRSNGAGFNLFTDTYRPLDLIHDVEIIEVNNAAFGIFAHGGGTNKGYRSILIPGEVRGNNVTNFVGFTKLASGAAFLDKGITIGEINGTDIDEAFDCGCDLTLLRGGLIDFSATSLLNAGSRTGLAKLSVAGSLTQLTGLSWRFKDERLTTTTRYLAYRTFVGGTAPTLHLTGCEDLSLPGREGRLFGSGNAGAVSIILDGGTVIGDLVGLYSATGYTPASLTVGAGCTFGFAGLTRAAMRTYFDGLSIPHSISNATTIVGPWGEIVELPA